MANIHGGDIYRNNVKIDFSVNTNPMGIPFGVREALRNAVELSNVYPDMECTKLRRAIGQQEKINPEWICVGNGASELFLAITHSILPRHVLIPTPSFYGYEHATNAVHSSIHTCGQKTEEILKSLTTNIDLLFLANPNNPTGVGKSKEELCSIVKRCKEIHAMIVLDECFIDFCDRVETMKEELIWANNLIIVRAFTKNFSIPGVRLGYLFCSEEGVLQEIKKHLPEWNVSVFAQEAGVACTKEKKFLEETVSYVKKERSYLSDGLRKLGMDVFPSEANFILFRCHIPLYDKLLERGILIRDCANYKGLSKGYYRIAVKNHKDNEMLLETIGECL